MWILFYLFPILQFLREIQEVHYFLFKPKEILRERRLKHKELNTPTTQPEKLPRPQFGNWMAWM